MTSGRELTSRLRRSIRPTRARRPSDASVDHTEAPNTMASGWRDLPTCVPVVTQSASAWHALHEPEADRLGTTRSRRSLGCEITWDPCEVAGWAFESGRSAVSPGNAGRPRWRTHTGDSSRAAARARIPPVRSPATAVRGAAAQLGRGRQATMPLKTPSYAVPSGPMIMPP
jgi:hypothetical protein